MSHSTYLTFNIVSVTSFLLLITLITVRRFPSFSSLVQQHVLLLRPRLQAVFGSSSHSDGAYVARTLRSPMP